MYSIKEIFYTLQGEGQMTGRPSVFCRFSGCNLWSGQEKHRQNAICKFCDTDFIGIDGANGGKYNAHELAQFIYNLWFNNQKNSTMQGKPYVVLTGGEPLLQIDDELILSLHNKNFEIAIETNGTQPMVQGIDWVCISPKAGSSLLINKGDEIKIIYPQDFTIQDMENFSNFEFKHFFIQAKDDKDKTIAALNLQKAISFCQHNSKWRLSVQTHKYLGIA